MGCWASTILFLKVWSRSLEELNTIINDRIRSIRRHRGSPRDRSRGASKGRKPHLFRGNGCVHSRASLRRSQRRAHYGSKRMPQTALNRVSFFSQLQGKKIVDKEGNSVGKLTDLSLRPGEMLLEISRIVLHLQHPGEKVILPMSSVSSINGDIRLDVARDEIPPGKLSDHDLLITETILRPADRGHRRSESCAGQ